MRVDIDRPEPQNGACGNAKKQNDYAAAYPAVRRENFDIMPKNHTSRPRHRNRETFENENEAAGRPVPEPDIPNGTVPERENSGPAITEPDIPDRGIQGGTLYICATPIGNLEDITLRVLNTLKTVDLIAAEDTRHSMKLLNHYDIHTPMTSYHEYNKVEKARALVAQLQEGRSIALITDAGTPAISDPGEELVRQCMAAGVPVTSLPGPSACVTALTLSGLPTRRFCFEAFLPSEKKERRQILDELKDETRTIIIYEAPHHLITTLTDLKETLGGGRSMTLCRELTKKYEEAWRTTIDGALSRFAAEEPRGECVILLEGRSMESRKEERARVWEEMSIEEHVALYEAQGLPRKEAMRQAAKDRGLSRRDIYQRLVEQE